MLWFLAVHCRSGFLGSWYWYDGWAGNLSTWHSQIHCGKKSGRGSLYIGDSAANDDTGSVHHSYLAILVWVVHRTQCALHYSYHWDRLLWRGLLIDFRGSTLLLTTQRVTDLVFEVPIQVYLVDVFTLYAASATAASVILRSLVGAFLPLAGSPMFQALGLGWGSSLLGFISLGMLPVPFVFVKYGERLRKKYPVKL